jgi:hypothetical protein
MAIAREQLDGASAVPDDEARRVLALAERHVAAIERLVA